MAIQGRGVVNDPTPEVTSIGGFPIYGLPAGEGEILVFRNLPTPGWYVEPGGGGGGGDMFKAVYDADNDSVVDAANAVRIGGVDLPGGLPADGTAIRYNSTTGDWVYVYMPESKSWPGNPNNFVDGRPGDFCRDTTNGLMWHKTTPLGNVSGWNIT